MASALNSITSGASTIRGYGGLASGLDTDSLIKGMTAATRAKIAKQQQKKQTYAWTQDAYRSISSKLVEFSKKYTSYTNQSTNLSSPSFWARSNVTAVGANSSYVSVSGSSSLSDTMSIVGVKQLAKNASMTSSKAVSDNSLTTGSINLGDNEVSSLEGQSLSFKYGNNTYTVSLKSGTTSDGYTYDYSNGKNAQESITRALKDVSIGGGRTLADVIKVSADPSNAADPEGTPFKLNIKSADTAGNTLLLDGGSQTALKALGFENITSLSEADRTINSDGFAQAVLDKQDFFETKTFAQRVGGKSISFNYNGTTKSIEFPSEEDIQAMVTESGGDDEAALNALAAKLQLKLDKQFGEKRIEVSTGADINGGFNLVFKTKDASTGADDNSSILALSSADAGIIGKNGALKVLDGESNRLNVNVSLADSGLNNIESKLLAAGKLNIDTTYFSGSIKAQAAIENLGSLIDDSTSLDELKQLIATKNPTMSDQDLSSINEAIDYFKDNESATNVGDLKSDMNSYVSNRELKLTINDVEIKGLSYNSTMTDIMNKINSSDAGVSISYMRNADKFSIKSTMGGVAGAVNIGGSDASMLFGTEGTDYTVADGQDAIVSVKYAGSDEVVNLIRDSNTFDMDGLNITINNTFGYSGGVLDEGTEPITFNAKTDSDSIVSAVSDLIKDFNEIVDLVNKEVSTKPNRSYEPLTDEQKEGMSEDQIKLWEDKAKAGMLFNDSELRGLTDSLRFIFDSGSADKDALSSFGISTSSDYGDNGKLVLDETKFRAALETNPEDIQKLFTRKEDTANGDQGGVMARLTAITNKYAGTTGATKGILIERAGSIYAPTSILNNAIQKSMDSLDTIIDRFNDQLQTETDRYIRQFTSLETLISQMNSQSSWLSSALG